MKLEAVMEDIADERVEMMEEVVEEMMEEAVDVISAATSSGDKESFEDAP